MNEEFKQDIKHNEEESSVLLDYVCNLSIDDQFFLDDINDRHIYCNGIIDRIVAEDVVYRITRYNSEDKDIPAKKRKPIKLFICSPGGSVDDGFRIISAIESSRTPVYTINNGYCYSMAFLLLIAGDVRYGSKYSTYLLHEGDFGIYNSDGKAIDEFVFNLQRDKMIKEYVIANTKISETEYDHHQRKEWYMFAKIAKEKAVIDYIIGQDIMINDVI